MSKDPRVDQYIAKAPAFARPILEEARKRVRAACPSAEEAIKWNVPFFLLGGKIVASMAAFKKHVKVGIWSGDKPDFADVTTVGELPAAKPFAAKLAAAIARLGDAGAAAPKKSAAKKAPAKKSAAKKAPARKAAAKKSAKARAAK